jgi:hypothetical protein
LVISATAWHVTGNPEDADLYTQLDHVVSQTASRNAPGEAAYRVAIADSKKLYKPRGGIRHIELGLLAALRLLGHRPSSWRELWDALAPDSGAHRQALPWYEDYALAVPVEAESQAIEEAACLLSEGTREANVRLAAIRSVAVFPKQFNGLTARLDSKGAVLTHFTLELLREVLEQLPDEPVLVVCDKHGGRNRYAAQLQQHFPDSLIEIHGEARSHSVYCWGPSERRTTIRFQAKGEGFLPAALASMASKYLREMAMKAFNDFWCRRIKHLRPTAGYPVDARRFWTEIAGQLAELPIDDDDVWRQR